MRQGFAATANGQPYRMDKLEGTGRLMEMMRDLSYPVQKWQITMCADIHGADIRTRRALYSLPVEVYHSMSEVIAALDDD